ncbi:hypothetical protein WT32_00785 [Burkholderia anthina]|nr:hypothetical protein WT32_00785 [Burkholderia anthina]
MYANPTLSCLDIFQEEIEQGLFLFGLDHRFEFVQADAIGNYLWLINATTDRISALNEVRQ